MTSSTPRQLTLLDDVLPPGADWRLDRETRLRGLRGVEAARKALADAAARHATAA